MEQINNCTMLFCTCDAYEVLWPVYFNNLRKYWPEFNMPIVLNSEGKGYEFGSYKIKSPMKTYANYTWSKRLIEVVNSIKTEFLLFTLDDFVLIDCVNNTTFERIFNHMQLNKRIGFVCLRQELMPGSSKQRYDHAITCQYPELHRCTKGYPFRITTQVGLWRKSYLLKLLRSRENAWQFEQWANFRANYNYQYIYGVNEPLFVYPAGGILWKGRVMDEHISLYDEDLIDPILKERGVISRNEHDNRVAQKKKRCIKDVCNLVQSLWPW